MANSFESVENSALKVNNMMQAELAYRRIGFQDDKKLVEWIGKYSKAFRKLVSEKPDFLTRYTAGDEEKEKVLHELEEALYTAEHVES